MPKKSDTTQTGGRKYTQRKPNLYKFESEGQIFEGTITKFDMTEISGKDVARLYAKGEDGINYVLLLGKQIESTFDDSDIGKDVRITYLGKVKTSSGKSLNDYNVEIADD